MTTPVEPLNGSGADHALSAGPSTLHDRRPVDVDEANEHPADALPPQPTTIPDVQFANGPPNGDVHAAELPILEFRRPPGPPLPQPPENGAANGHAPAAEPFSLDERRKAALALIDNAKFSPFLFKVCMVAGVGFFSDAYNIFAITIASTMIGYVVGVGGKLSPEEELGLKMSAPLGIIVGQLLFGWLADRVGRKSMYGIELIIMVISTFGQALSGGTGAAAVPIVGSVIAWRFLMGIGIGGDYPLSAIIVSEFAPIKYRGRMMTFVVASQGWGHLAAAIVALVVVSAFRSELDAQANNPICALNVASSLLASAPPNDPNCTLTSVDRMWRLLVGLGCIPPAIGLFFRMTVSETPRFTIDIDRNLDQGVADIATALYREGNGYDDEIVRRVIVPKASWHDFKRYFGQWKNLRILLGVSYSWFAIDVTFYGLGLNSSDLLQNIFFPSNHTIYDNLHNAAATNIILSVAGFIPGYYASFVCIDRWGRIPIQIMGFTALGVIFIILGAASEPLRLGRGGEGGTLFLYCLINFFQNFGPNTTTFVIPGELFPTRYRSTCHGIAAASGKLGAVISLAMFYKIKTHYPFPSHILAIFCLFMLTGMGATLWIPETKLKSLEDLSNENPQVFVEGYARAHEMVPLLPQNV